MVSFWKTADDLYGKSGIALMKTFAAQPREGWVRASEANTSEMTAEITRLSRENGNLRTQLASAAVKEEEGHKANIDLTIDALRRNLRRIYVWAEGATDWGAPIDTNLLSIFESMAPDLLDEGSNKALADALGLRFGASQRAQWPVPQNFVKAYLADLVSLHLVSNSAKRHGVSDTQAYWMLTEFGREVHGNIRRNELLKGLTDFVEKPEVEPIGA